MKSGDHDDALRIAIRQIIEDWESGKIEARPAMAAITKLIDYVLPPGERTKVVVYPFAECRLVDPIQSDTPAGYGADPEEGKDRGKS